MLLNGTMTPDSSIIRELKALDPGLFPHFSEYELDKATGSPLLTAGGIPILRPRWSIWQEDPKTGQMYFLFYHEDVNKPEADRTFLPLDMRAVDRIRQDLGRQGFSPKQVADMMMNSQKAWRDKREADMQDLREEVLKANKRKITEAMESMDGREGDASRDAKTFSYAGQTTRTSGAERKIEKSDKELGWELPSQEEIDKVMER